MPLPVGHPVEVLAAENFRPTLCGSSRVDDSVVWVKWKALQLTGSTDRCRTMMEPDGEKWLWLKKIVQGEVIYRKVRTDGYIPGIRPVVLECNQFFSFFFFPEFLALFFLRYRFRMPDR